MLTIVNKKTWRTCDFPVWERVKHIVPVYNVHPLLQIKESGKNPAHYTTLNTVLCGCTFKDCAKNKISNTCMLALKPKKILGTSTYNQGC